MSEKTYQALVERVKRKIGSPAAQLKLCCEIQRQPEDAADDWTRMLSELGTVENVTIIPLDDDGELFRVRWNPEESMS
ncbi:DUF1654 domain-containing protein [Halomonas citrativorans]|uniref:DUF1654 domain-containing protein n=1 Tax=Halomonas citrativorans TaxID=2742612 RepID=A0ABR9FCY5_9GAMM|nr:DUF1654 domain-containing protein [Halomonas citrativorans]MBE0403055.1 DUF1654 domain-containing protein [Halomonas citrativorans]